MPVLASTVDEYFTDAMSIAANNITTTSMGTSPTFVNYTGDDLFIMGSLLSDDIWNKFGLETPSDQFFDLKEIFEEEEKAAIADMMIFDELSLNRSASSSSTSGSESDSSNSSSTMGFCIFEDLFEIRNHDCMWAGHCGSKEHPTDEQPLVRPITAPIIAARQSIQQSLRGENHLNTSNRPAIQVQVPAGRSVLLKTVKQQQQQQQQQQTAVGPTPNNGGFSPDTPPMSDDEEIKAKTLPLASSSTVVATAAHHDSAATSTLQILQSVIDDYDIKVDSDLCDYLEDDDSDLLKVTEDLIKQEDIDDNEETDDGLPDEEEEEEEALAHEEKRNQQQRSREVYNQFPSDHCYHKGTSLSYETPSDSDDEIDVVSISEPPVIPQPTPRYSRGHLSYHQLQQLQQQHKRSTAHNNLPYNPSTRDRQQLQRTVATVMSNKKMVSTGQQYTRLEQPTATTTSKNYPRVKTLLPLHRTTAQTSSTGTHATSRKAYTEHQPLGHGGKRKHTSNSKYTTGASSSTSKYTRKRANYHNSSDSEAEPSEKRSLHNNMERQRRIDLRNAFEHLRVMVPEVNKRDRAAKVVILREARMYCNRLTTMDEDHQMQIDELKEHQERLRARVSQLRRSLANKHR